MEIIWKTSHKDINYLDAMSYMENLVNSIVNNQENETIWMLSHSHLYTRGSSSEEHELLEDSHKKYDIPVFKSGRGGKITYHGPGQRIAYIMLNLKKRFHPHQADLKKYVFFLEQSIINTLKRFGISGMRLDGKIGIWVNVDESYKKIAAIGIRVRKWVSYHGVAINLNPDLSYFKGIIPCGIEGYGVTSFEELGKNVTIKQFDMIFKEEIMKVIQQMHR